MLQKPNTVFVAKKVNTAGTSLVAGDLVVINAETGAVSASSVITTLASAPKSIQFGFVKTDGTIAKTQVISRKNITNIVYDAYVAKTVASAVISFAGVTPVIGHRYVLRCIYRDLYEHPGQFTHSYEVIAKTTVPADLAIAFNALINTSSSARVTSTIVGSIITLTAKSVTDNGFGTQGKEAITPYSQVQLRVVAYVTDPKARFTISAKDAIVGLTIVQTESQPGKGNAYIVRDREQAALAYKGITYRTEWPVIKPELNVDLTATYDSLVIEYSKQYQSPDNQYMKSTDLAAEIYVDHSNTGTLSALNTLISDWASLVGPQGIQGV